MNIIIFKSGKLCIEYRRLFFRETRQNWGHFDNVYAAAVAAADDYDDNADDVE